MSLFEDATQFLKSKQNTSDLPQKDDILYLDTPTQYENFFAQMRGLYENATRMETESAISRTQGELEKPYDKKLFLEKMRVRLED